VTLGAALSQSLSPFATARHDCTVEQTTSHIACTALFIPCA
jgi:hypothetical protein